MYPLTTCIVYFTSLSALRAKYNFPSTFRRDIVVKCFILMAFSLGIKIPVAVLQSSFFYHAPLTLRCNHSCLATTGQPNYVFDTPFGHGEDFDLVFMRRALNSAQKSASLSFSTSGFVYSNNRFILPTTSMSFFSSSVQYNFF